MQSSDEHSSSREGTEEEFDPARQARFALKEEGLHLGLATESLLEALLQAPSGMDVMEVDLADSERNLLASILMKEDEELTPERLEGAVRALKRIQIRRKLDEIQQQLKAVREDSGQVAALLQ